MHRLLCAHPQASGFRGTGVPEDEGQHLQDVYKAASWHGGPGRFGFDPEAHLTESTPLVTEANRARLLDQWSRFWDMSRPVLIEKSPPNLIRARFLQAMFPNSCFVFLLRHPLAVSMATEKWQEGPLSRLIEHWLVCHKIMLDDVRHLRKSFIMRYENFVNDPDRWLGAICDIIEVKRIPCAEPVHAGLNSEYFQSFRDRLRTRVVGNKTHRCLNNQLALRQHAASVERFGYSLVDLGTLGVLPEEYTFPAEPK